MRADVGRWVRITVVALLFCWRAYPAALGQAINSNSGTITLNATLSETLTISATPNTVNFTLVAGGNANASAPVAITTTWVLSGTRSSVVLDGFFSSASAALSSSAPVANIPTSDVYGLVSTGAPTTYTAFTQTAALGSAGTGLTLFTQAITSSNTSFNRTDNLMLQIQLASTPQLPAATYTGTLTLQAQAM